MLKRRSSDPVMSKYAKDSGEIVQTVIIIAVMAVVAILVMGVLAQVVKSKGKATANCINGASVFTSSSEAIQNCKDAEKDSHDTTKPLIDSAFADSGFGGGGGE